MSVKASFEFSPTSANRAVPEWMWDKKPVLAAVSLDTLAEVFGPPGELTADEIVQQHRAALEGIARRKVQWSQTRPIEPVLITLDDFSL